MCREAEEVVNPTKSNRPMAIARRIKQDARIPIAISAVVTVVAVLGAPQKW